MIDIATIAVIAIVFYTVGKHFGEKRAIRPKPIALDIEIENRTGYAINLEIDENVVYLLDVEGEVE
jgi:hypothetical protein